MTKKYFKVSLGRDHKKVLYIKSTDMDYIALWVLRNRPMNDFYGMNIVQVNPETKESYSGADFMCEAVAEYYHYEFKGMSDEEIRQELIICTVNRIKSKEVA